ncbi:MAG: hypothetical protein ACREPU_09175 [Rhodanobacteraceae bacterium]
MKMMKKALVIGVTGALAIGLSFAAFAEGDVGTEISTAHTHAVYAKQATSVAVSHVHLHHVINCLVGPKGTGFDAKQADPCKGQGNGALPDSAGDAALHSKLETALSEAQTGLKANDLATVHSDANKVASTLMSADPAGKPKASKDKSSW